LLHAAFLAVKAALPAPYLSVFSSLGQGPSLPLLLARPAASRLNRPLALVSQLCGSATWNSLDSSVLLDPSRYFLRRRSVLVSTLAGRTRSVALK